MTYMKKIIVLSLFAICQLLCAHPIEAHAEPSSTTYKAAAVQYDPAWGDLDGNIERIVAAIDQVSETGARLMVFPEQATTGYIFDNFDMVRPYLDTIPGKTSDAISKATKAKNVYVSIGIAEIDPVSGLGYNSVALIGPEGYIGKYRKHGLNSQDQRWVSPGNLGFPVFDTELGRIMLLICYDDTYWQYARLALLHDVDVLAWSSASDRVMSGSPKFEFKLDHSTVANVQYLSRHTGAWVVAATRSGIETNPKTGQKLYYNGGSSLWSPSGNKIAQADVVAPENLPPGVHGVAIANIDISQSKPVRDQLLKRRRPELYGLLALHRSPTDSQATTKIAQPKLSAQAAPASRPLAYDPPAIGGLLVLPALFMSGSDEIQGTPNLESENGASEQFMAQLATKGRGYVVGSYARKVAAGNLHTVAMADPTGKIIARYDATHLSPNSEWAKPGNNFAVVPTAIGRIGLTLGEELVVPEVFGHLSSQRADIIAAPARQTSALPLQIDSKLFAVPNPKDTPYDAYVAAMLSQTWVVTAGWHGKTPSSWIFGPDPVIHSAPMTNAAKESRVERKVKIPWAGTWINQQQLIAGQRPETTIPLALDPQGACYQEWRRSAGWKPACW